MWCFTCGWSLRFGSRLIHEVTFKITIESEAAIRPVSLAPLNAIVCLVVAYVIGVTFGVNEDNSSLTALVFLFERLKT